MPPVLKHESHTWLWKLACDSDHDNESGVRFNLVGSDLPCCNHKTKLPLPAHWGTTLQWILLWDSTKMHHLKLPILLQNTVVDHREPNSPSPDAIKNTPPHPVWWTWSKRFILGNDSRRTCEEAEQQTTHKVDINPDKILKSLKGCCSLKVGKNEES